MSSLQLACSLLAACLQLAFGRYELWKIRELKRIKRDKEANSFGGLLLSKRVWKERLQRQKEIEFVLKSVT